MKKYYLIFTLLIGITIGVLCTVLCKRNHYTFLKVNDSENKYNDLIILDTETGDIYLSNGSDDFTEFTKRTYKK